jgi:hypothetical protein
LPLHLSLVVLSLVPQVLHCTPGYGYVSTLRSLERAILRINVKGVEHWVCHACSHPNATPPINSVLDYLELSLAQLDSLVRCGAAVARWVYCVLSVLVCVPVSVLV